MLCVDAPTCKSRVLFTYFYVRTYIVKRGKDGSREHMMDYEAEIGLSKLAEGERMLTKTVTDCCGQE